MDHATSGPPAGPRRAKRVWECAVVLTERHGGRVPDDDDALMALPGVGAYTAAAVASFAFGRRAVVLDTNVRRVIGRAWSGEPLPPPESKGQKFRLTDPTKHRGK